MKNPIFQTSTERSACTVPIDKSDLLANDLASLKNNEFFFEPHQHIVGLIRFIVNTLIVTSEKFKEINPTSSPRPYVSPEENETKWSRFLQERHMAVGTRLF